MSNLFVLPAVQGMPADISESDGRCEVARLHSAHPPQVWPPQEWSAVPIAVSDSQPVGEQTSSEET